MMFTSEKEDFQKDYILERCFNCMVEMGVENISIRKFSNVTGMTASSLYYWFKDKDEIVIKSTEYGMRKIVDSLLDIAHKTFDLDTFCDKFPEYAKEHSAPLRLIFQITTSPKYSKAIVPLSEGVTKRCDNLATELSNNLHIPYDELRAILDLFTSALVDCIIWEEWDKFKREIEWMVRHIKKNLLNSV